MGKKIKIPIILLYCGVRTGNFGAGSHIENLLPAFKSRKEDFLLYIIKTDDKMATTVYEDREDDILVLHIPQPENKLYLTVSQDLVQKTYAKRLVEIIYPFIKEKENPIFLTNSIDYLNLGFELKENLICSLIYIHHSWTWKIFNNVPDEEFTAILKKGDYTGIEKAVIFTSFQKEMAMLADKVVTVTHQAKQFFINTLNINPEKISTIYNGIVPPIIDKYSKTEIKEKLGIKRSERVILYSGRIKEDKGLIYLIKAFNEVIQQFPNSRLVMVGSGDYDLFKPFTDPISSKVTYTGKLKKDDLEEWYKITDVGILPSLHEQCSFTAIEMRFFKIPLIVSAVDGLDEMFTHNFDAMKLTVGLNEKGQKTLDHKEIANYIISLIEDKNLSCKITDNSYQVAMKSFTAKKMQCHYVDILTDMGAKMSTGSDF